MFHQLSILLADKLIDITVDKSGTPAGIIPSPSGNIPQAKEGISSLTSDVITILFSVAGGIVIFVMLYLGYQMLTSSGKDDEIKKGFRGITNAAIGLAIMGIAYAIVKSVLSWNF